MNPSTFHAAWGLARSMLHVLDTSTMLSIQLNALVQRLILKQATSCILTLHGGPMVQELHTLVSLQSNNNESGKQPVQAAAYCNKN